MDMDRRQLEALDRYITGNYGEDQFKDYDEKGSDIFVYQVVDKDDEHVDFEDNPFDTLEKAQKFIDSISKGKSCAYKICKVEL